MPKTQLVHDWLTGSLIISEIEVPDDQIAPAGNPLPTEPADETPSAD
jgi:hypothetical protein